MDENSHSLEDQQQPLESSAFDALQQPLEPVDNSNNLSEIQNLSSAMSEINYLAELNTLCQKLYRPGSSQGKLMEWSFSEPHPGVSETINKIIK